MDAKRQMKVLLVEDELLVLLDEQRRLTRQGYEVETARTAAEAISAAARIEDIRFLVTDVDLGSGMDGIEAAKVILGKRPMPVLFLTSSEESDIRERAKDIGAYRFLNKAAPKSALLQAMEAALDGVSPSL